MICMCQFRALTGSRLHRRCKLILIRIESTRNYVRPLPNPAAVSKRADHRQNALGSNPSSRVSRPEFRSVLTALTLCNPYRGGSQHCTCSAWC